MQLQGVGSLRFEKSVFSDDSIMDVADTMSKSGFLIKKREIFFRSFLFLCRNWILMSTWRPVRAATAAHHINTDPQMQPTARLCKA